MLSKQTIIDCLSLIKEYYSLDNQKKQLLYELDKKIGFYKNSIFPTHDIDTRVNLANEEFIQSIIEDDFPYFLEDKLVALFADQFGG